MPKIFTWSSTTKIKFDLRAPGLFYVTRTNMQANRHESRQFGADAAGEPGSVLSWWRCASSQDECRRSMTSCCTGAQWSSGVLIVVSWRTPSIDSTVNDFILADRQVQLRSTTIVNIQRDASLWSFVIFTPKATFASSFCFLSVTEWLCNLSPFIPTPPRLCCISTVHYRLCYLSIFLWFTVIHFPLILQCSTFVDSYDPQSIEVAPTT